MVFIAIVVAIIVCVQLYFFGRNLKRMIEFKDIFSKPDTWVITKDFSSGFVSGINGQGNTTFEAIKESINKYLYSNKGSVIDFGLLKDATDRHCDSIEDDINAQTPVPLYCGLAGTMFGVICGLVPLIYSGALIFLLNGEKIEGYTREQMNAIAASGINDLLAGVAWAMTASIFGIILTTANSLLFKRYKLKQEQGKNTFLAWMQAILLPELPTDTGDALKQLVKNLNKFNATFANNAQQLDNTLARVNQVYHEQDEIIQTVHDMDVMKMAKANVKVLQELQQCTEQLQEFNIYLHAVKGYTENIEKFNEQFNQEAERLHILEEIRDFFKRHKAELSKEVADSDNALKSALKKMNESSADNILELTKNLTEQTDHFKSVINDQREMFKEFCEDMRTTYATQMNMVPDLTKRLDKISAIPGSVEKMISEIKASNQQLNVQVANEVRQTLRELASRVSFGGGGVQGNDTPSWMKISIVAGVIIIAIACVGNTAFNVWNGMNNNSSSTVPTKKVLEGTTATNDTLSAQPIEAITFTKNTKGN